MFSISGYKITFAVQCANSSLIMVTFDHQSLHFCLTLSVALVCGLGLEDCGLSLGLENYEDYGLSLGLEDCGLGLEDRIIMV